MKRSWWAPSYWAAVVGLLAVLLGGCGGGADAPPETPLLGVYRAPVGAEVEFMADGRYRSSSGGGRFTVDGDALTLTWTNGQKRTGKRLSADIVQLDSQTASMKFYRVGSAAAQTTEATTRPPPTPAAPPTRPQPDRSTPLSAYTPITSGADLTLLAAAFADPPLDDQAKRDLVPGLAGVADSFERQKRAVEGLPAVNARLAELARSRYVRFAVSTVGTGMVHRTDPKAVAGWVLSQSAASGREPIQPYDHQAKGFGLACLNRTSVVPLNGQGSFSFPIGTSDRGCLLPVTDETQARALEAARAQHRTFFLRAEVYAFVEDAQGPAVNLVPVRFDVSVLDPTDPTFERVLATVPVEL